MAIPFIKHSHIGKSQQKQAYTAAAHVRYISRQSATVYRYAERMPLHYHAAQRFLNEREDRIRKNGRVIDKLVISIPREMTMDQAVDTIRNFGFQLSQGRAPFYFTIQDWGKNNPHAHFILVDADCETGARVFRTTDRDSTDRIKALWEKVCNSHLQDLGIDASISFEEAAQKKAERLEAEQYDNDNQPVTDHSVDATEMVTPQLSDESGHLPPDAPSNELELEDEKPIPAEDETDAEDAPEGDEDMAVPVSTKLANARREMRELQILRAKRVEVGKLRADYAYWSGEAVIARQKSELAKNAVEDAYVRTTMATQAWKETHFMGFRKGLNFKIGPLHIRTPGIEKAIRAEAEWEKAAYAEAVRAADFREANDYANRATQKVAELDRRVAGLEQHIGLHERINGEEFELQEAEDFFTDNIGRHLHGLSPNDIIDVYEAGDLTVEDAKQILHHIGHPELANWIEAQQEEQGLKH